MKNRNVHEPIKWCSVVAMTLATITILCSTRSTSAQVSLQGAVPTNTLASSLTGSQSADLVILERGAHHRQWARVEWTRDRFGQVVARTNLAYVELGNGMHRRDPQTGAWIECREVIEPVPGGAIARQGQHTVFFANDLSSAGSIRLRSADGKLFSSTPYGLAYFDASNGAQILLAQIKSCQGAIIQSNQVLYSDAMTDISCSIRYTYTRGGFEQDVILADPTQLPSPTLFGMNPRTTRLLVLTEFQSPPSPAKQIQSVAQRVAPAITDEHLDFGVMQIGSGSGFLLGTNGVKPSLRIFKEWTQLEGRDFLIEQVPMPDLWQVISTLPRSEGASVNRLTNAIRFSASTLGHLPKLTVAKPGADSMQVASIQLPEQGLLLDYATVSSMPNYVFQSDVTYYVQSACTISDTATFEGNTVIKVASAPAGLTLNHVVCKTGPYRMAIVTSKNDNQIGEIISGSSGNPDPLLEGATFINASATANTYSYFRFMFAGTGLRAYQLSQGIWHCQFVKCTTGVVQDDDGSSAFLYNCLFSGGTRAISTIGIGVHGEHITSNCGSFNTQPNDYVTLVNSIVPNASIVGTKNFDNCDTTSSTVFQAKGAGNSYIPSPIRGSANINSTLRNALKLKTVLPPTLVANHISATTSWSQTALRDAGPNFWRGFHYDPLDYLVGSKILTASLTLQDGVAVAVYGSQNGYGISLGSGAKILSQGTPLKMNYLVRYQTVQEQSSSTWGNYCPLLALNASYPSDEVQLRFTQISQPANSFGRRYLLFNVANNILSKLVLTDCAVYGGDLSINFDGQVGPPTIAIALTNNSFQRVHFEVYQDTGSQSDCVTFQSWNNLFRGGYLRLGNYTGTSTWRVNDTLFDTVPTLMGECVQNSHNAYVATTQGLGGSDPDKLTPATPDYQSGPLGDFYYLATGSLAALINHGSRDRSTAGLYHHTVKAAVGSKEGTDSDPTVDIGFHYVGVSDAAGNPIDSDQDGTPDYREDANGNGVLDVGETGYANPVIYLTGGASTYIEHNPAIRIDNSSAVAVADNDSPDFNGGSLAVSLSANGSDNDRIAINGDGTDQITLAGSTVKYQNIAIGTYTGGIGTTPLVVTFSSGYANTLSARALIRNITFNNVSQNPSTATRTVQMILRDGDGGTSSPATKNISVVAANNPPLVTVSKETTHYDPATPAVLVDPLANVEDPDSQTFNGGSLTVSFTSDGNVQPEDELGIHNNGSHLGQISTVGDCVTFGGVCIGSYVWNSTSKVLTVAFNSASSPAAAVALLRSITYRNTLASWPPSFPRTRKIQIVVNDGQNASQPRTKNIQLGCLQGVAVMLVIDRSVSMDQRIAVGDDQTKLGAAVAAATAFLDNLQSSDSAGLVSFAGSEYDSAPRASLDAPLGTDIATIKSRISQLRAGGGTFIESGIGLAKQELVGKPNSVMIILTDGVPTADPERVNTGAAAKAARDAGVRIITIGLGSHLEFDESLLIRIASENSARPSGHDYYHAPNAPDLPGIYSSIAGTLCIPANRAPVVNAGADKTIKLPNHANLSFTIQDDGRPTGQTVHYLWTAVSGPQDPNTQRTARVTFGTPVEFGAPIPHTEVVASFVVPGTYRLRLTANDSELSAFDDILVFVYEDSALNQPPIVSAGVPQWALANTDVQLHGAVTDDGLPNSNPVTINWTVEKRPKDGNTPPSFSQGTSSLDPVVRFQDPGSYVLMCTATDAGALSGADTVTITVCTQQEIPVDVALIMDRSGSMSDKLGDAQVAAKTFVDLINLSLDQVALVSFASDVTLDSRLTGDANSIKLLLDAWGAEGDTTMSPAVALAQSELQSSHRNPAADPVIILLSDGAYDNQSDDVSIPAKAAKLAGTRIISILVGPSTDSQKALMEKLASSEDDFYALDSSTDLSKIYSSIAQSFCYAGNRNPVVELGPDRFVDESKPLILYPSVYDENPTALQYSWSKVSGPGTATCTRIDNPPTATPCYSISFSAVGQYVLQLSVSDGVLGDVDQITIDVGSNTPPNASDDWFVVEADSINNVLNVLANDSDVDADPITIVDAGASFVGSKIEVISDAKQMRYTPAAGFRGVENFSYTITDGKSAPVTAVARVYVFGKNHPPLAYDDNFYVLKNTGSAIPTYLDVISNDTDNDRINQQFTDEYFLKIIGVTQPPIGQGVVSTVDAGGGYLELYYLPPLNWPSSGEGVTSFTYTIADRYGATSTANVTLHVWASLNDRSNVQPVVNAGPDATVQMFAPYILAGSAIDDGLPANASGVPLGLSYSWMVQAFPAGAQESDVSFSSPNSPPENYPSAMVTFAKPGTYTLKLTAFDGQLTGQDTVDVHVRANGIAASVISPAEGDRIGDGILNVGGVADDPGTPLSNFSYELRLFSSNPYLSPGMEAVATSIGSTAVPAQAPTDIPGSLGQLDLTRLRNGTYFLELIVHNGGLSKEAGLTSFVLDSPLKLGRLTLSQEDVLLPAGGLPLTVVRTYDSQNPNSGDFGYSWSYAINDLDVEIDEERTYTQDDDGNTFSLRTGGGRNVTLTLPDGRRTTFICSFRQGFVGTYYAEWSAAPWVHATLTPSVDNRLYALPCIGTYWAADSFRSPMENFDFPGYVLTMEDGTRYEIARQPEGEHTSESQSWQYVRAYSKPKLQSIVKPNGNCLKISDYRVEQYNNVLDAAPTRSLILERDALGRITGVADPRGVRETDSALLIKYEYDGLTGNLTKIRKLSDKSNPAIPVYQDTKLYYEDQTNPHYLTRIEDPRHISPLLTQYQAGRIVKTTDAYGRDTLYSYDLDNRMETIEDPSHNQTLLEYDGRGNVLQATLKDASGLTVSRIFRTYDDANNMLEEEGGPSGHRVYTYDQHGNRTSERLNIQNPVTALPYTSTMSYNGFGQVAEMIDFEGHVNRSEYDNYGQLTKTTDAVQLEHPTPKSSLYGYANGDLVYQVDLLNNQTVYAYYGVNESGGRAHDLKSITMRDANNSVLRTTSYTYDENGNQLTESTSRTTANGSENVVTSYNYDLENRLVRTIDALGNASSNTYNSIGKTDTTTDPLGRTTSYLYDKRGNLVQTTYPGDANTPVSITRTVYDDNGRPIYVQDRHVRPASGTQSTATGTHTVFDGAGRVIEVHRLAGLTVDLNPDSGAWTASLVNTPTDLSHTSTQFNVDGQVEGTADAKGTAVHFYYDEAGRRVKTQRQPDADHTQYAKNDYDGNGNVTASYIVDASDNELGGRIGYEYDSLNRLRKLTGPSVIGVHNSSNPNAVVTTYDELGRVTEKIDQAGVKTRFAYDGLSQLRSVTKAYGLPDQTSSTYQYDEVGNMIQQADGENHVTLFNYDANGHRLSRSLPATAPENLVEYFSYDAVGNCINHTDFNGKVTSFQYDALNRLYKRTQDPAFGSRTITLSYYPDGRRYTVADTARGTTTYVYDNRNYMTRKVSPEGVLTYTFDDNGNVLTVRSVKSDGNYVTPYGGVSLSYDWDYFDRLKKVSDTTGGSSVDVAKYSYDLFDRLYECAYPAAANVKHVYAYNNANWLTAVNIVKDSQSRGSFNYDFARPSSTIYYGRTGTRMGASETLSGMPRSTQWDYDPLYRLNRESIPTGNPNGTIIYDSASGYGDTGGFDKVGNRRSRASTVDAVLPATYVYRVNDRLQADQYDSNGNTTSSGGLHYTYDYENRLLTRDGAPSLSFTYDHDGSRVSKTVNSPTVTTTYYLVDEQNPSGYPQVVEELNTVGANPSLNKKYTYGLRLISRRVGTEVQYYGHDGRGSTRLLMSPAGDVTQTYSYDAFGIATPATDPLDSNNYLFCGEQYDRDLGMYYFRARYYQPNLGRFWTMDNYEVNPNDPSSLHRYLYCQADPINRLDPGGLKDFSLTVSYTGDAVLWFSDSWAGAGNVLSKYKVCVSIGPCDNVFECVRRRLDSEKFAAGRDKITSLTFAAHGSPGHFGNFSWDVNHPELDVTDFSVLNLNRKNSAQSQLLGYLRPFLDSRSDVTLMACEQAKGSGGLELMQNMADRLQVPVSGFDDWIAVWGRGNKWTAYPGGGQPGGTKPRITKPGKPWKGTYSEYLYHIEDYVHDFCLPELVN